MTEQEAIIELQQNIDLPFGFTVSDEVSEIAIKALEKQVPKKPIQDEHFQHDYICSCCGGKIAESVDDNCCLEEEMAGWCPYCGQKLDWEGCE